MTKERAAELARLSSERKLTLEEEAELIPALIDAVNSPRGQALMAMLVHRAWREEDELERP